MPKNEGIPRKSKMELRYRWVADLEAAQKAKALQGRRWLGSIRKKFRVRAAPWINVEVRRLVHQLGYRYVLYDERLPGSPHLSFPSRKLVIFTVAGAPSLFRGGPPNPSSRSEAEREAWELLAVQKALTERGWRCELVTSEDARTKRSLRRRIREIFSEVKP